MHPTSKVSLHKRSLTCLSKVTYIILKYLAEHFAWVCRVWNDVISPISSYIGFSILFRLVRISPFAYLLNFGHNFVLYSEDRIARNFSTFRLFPQDMSSLTLLSRYTFRRDLEFSWTQFNLNHASSSFVRRKFFSGLIIARPYSCLGFWLYMFYPIVTCFMTSQTIPPKLNFP